MSTPRRFSFMGFAGLLGLASGSLCVGLPAYAAAPGPVSEVHPAPAGDLPDKQAEGQPAPDEIVELPAEPAAQRPTLQRGVDLSARLESLEQKNVELTSRLQDLDRRLQIITTQNMAVRLTGYIDAGFFAFFRGNGSGITNYVAQPQVPGNLSDANARYVSFLNSGPVRTFPEFFTPCGDGGAIRDAAGMVVSVNATAPVTCAHAPGLGYTQTQPRWRFLGDPLATAVNSAGHPADNRSQNIQGQSSMAVPYDYIQSAGRPTFLINEINLTPISKLGEHFQAVASINFYPRSASVSIGDKTDGGSQVAAGPTRVGDYFFADLAYLEYQTSFSGDRHHLSVFAGRFDPNIGIEYRVRKSPDRFGVTPSLMCRYSCGTPVGLKVRGRFFDDWVSVALAVHNGSSFQEQLFRFAENTDKKYMKTISGRLAIRAPVLGGVELGVSGEYGGEVDGFYDTAGRGEADPFVAQWTVDVDLHLEYRGFEFRGEFLRAQADGSPTRALPRLVALGGYLEGSYRLLNWLGAMVRWDVRDAVHIDYTVPYAYVAQLWRLTAGLRFDVNDNIAVKAEYLHLQPFGRMAQGLADNAASAAGPAAGDFQADYLTSSLVLRY